MKTVILTIAAVGTSFAPRAVEACDLASNLPFVPEPAGPALTPPGAVEIEVSFEDFDVGGDCGEAGIIKLDAAPSAGCPLTDATPSCGYRLTVLDGEPFEGFPDALVAEAYQGYMIFFVDENASVDVELEVRAVNRRGEEGPPTTVQVTHDFDGGGCSVGGGAGALVALALAGLRRRRTA